MSISLIKSYQGERVNNVKRFSVATSVTQPKSKVPTQGKPPIEEKPATEPVTQQDNLASSQKQSGEARETAQMQAAPVSRILTEQEVTALRAEAKSIIGDHQFVDFLEIKLKLKIISMSMGKLFLQEKYLLMKDVMLKHKYK